jgi:hypothetical protein
MFFEKSGIQTDRINGMNRIKTVGSPSGVGTGQAHLNFEVGTPRRGVRGRPGGPSLPENTITESSKGNEEKMEMIFFASFVSFCSKWFNSESRNAEMAFS